MSPCQLYLISPARLSLSDFLPRLDAALATGRVACFQLRLKDVDETDIRAALRETLPVARAHDVAFLLNDNPHLAAEFGCDGVHLGQDDMSPQEARAIVGADAVIGVSCHASRHLAIEAAEQGADYVAFGAFHPTRSKPMEKIEKWGMPAPDILTVWSETTTLPCVAIGGITSENAAPLVQAGADFLAVITAVWEHANGPAAGVGALHDAVQAASGR